MDWNICVQAINRPFRKPMFLPASTQTAARRSYYKTIIGYYCRVLDEKRSRFAVFFRDLCRRRSGLLSGQEGDAIHGQERALAVVVV